MRYKYIEWDKVTVIAEESRTRMMNDHPSAGLLYWTLKLGWGNLRLLYWMLKSYWIWGLHSWWWAGELVCVCFLCSVVLVESEVRLLLLWMKNEVKVNQLLLCGCILLRMKSMWIIVYGNQIKQNKRSSARVKILRWKYVKCGWKGIFESSLVIKIVQKSMKFEY